MHQRQERFGDRAGLGSPGCGVSCLHWPQRVRFLVLSGMGGGGRDGIGWGHGEGGRKKRRIEKNSENKKKERGRGCVVGLGSSYQRRFLLKGNIEFTHARMHF